MREKIYKELKRRPQQKLAILAKNIRERQENVSRVLLGMVQDKVLYKTGNGFYRVDAPMPDSYTRLASRKIGKEKRKPARGTLGCVSVPRIAEAAVELAKPDQDLDDKEPWGIATVEKPAYKEAREEIWGPSAMDNPEYKAAQESLNKILREQVDRIPINNQEKEIMMKGQKPTPAEEAMLKDASVFGAKMKEPAFVMPQLENYYLQIGIIENMVSQMGDCLLSENMKLLETFLKECVPIWENNDT